MKDNKHVRLPFPPDVSGYSLIYEDFINVNPRQIWVLEEYYVSGFGIESGEYKLDTFYLLEYKRVLFGNYKVINKLQRKARRYYGRTIKEHKLFDTGNQPIPKQPDFTFFRDIIGTHAAERTKEVFFDMLDKGFLSRRPMNQPSRNFR